MHAWLCTNPTGVDALTWTELPTPVPKETIMAILQAATRSPSGGNGQPWELYVASGASMERIRAAYQERTGSQAGGPPPRPADAEQPRH